MHEPDGHKYLPYFEIFSNLGELNNDFFTLTYETLAYAKLGYK